MMTLILIAVVIIALAAVIAKIHSDNKLFKQLLFCFCLSVCISGGMKQIFYPENSIKIHNTNNKIEKIINSHTVPCDSIARINSESNTVGKVNNSINLIGDTYSSQYALPIIPLIIVKHMIFDSS